MAESGYSGNLVTEEFLGKMGKTEKFLPYFHPWPGVEILFYFQMSTLN